MKPVSRRKFLTGGLAVVVAVGTGCSTSRNAGSAGDTTQASTPGTSDSPLPATKEVSGGTTTTASTAAGVPEVGAPPVTAVPPVTAAAEPGDIMGTLNVPGLGTFDIVESAATPDGLIVEESLDVDGVSHHAGTTPLGERGVTVIAGHRTQSPAPFNRIDTIKIGDVLTVTTIAGFIATYRVVETKVVDADDPKAIAEVLDNTVAYGTDSRLNLYSCSKADGSPTSTDFRYIVFAVRS